MPPPPPWLVAAAGRYSSSLPVTDSIHEIQALCTSAHCVDLWRPGGYLCCAIMAAKHVEWHACCLYNQSFLTAGS